MEGNKPGAPDPCSHNASLSRGPAPQVDQIIGARIIAAPQRAPPAKQPVVHDKSAQQSADHQPTKSIASRQRGRGATPAAVQGSQSAVKLKIDPPS